MIQEAYRMMAILAHDGYMGVRFIIIHSYFNYILCLIYSCIYKSYLTIKRAKHIKYLTETVDENSLNEGEEAQEQNHKPTQHSYSLPCYVSSTALTTI